MEPASPVPDEEINQRAPARASQALYAWAAMIFVLSVVPIPQMVPGKFMFFSFDTVAHAAFYVPLGALFLWAYPGGGRLAGWARAAAFAFVFGLIIELIQAVLPWRAIELGDMIADLLGGAAGAAFALAFPRLAK
jgi:VanZ family protein